MREFELQYRFKSNRNWFPGHAGLTVYKGKPSKQSIARGKQTIIEDLTIFYPDGSEKVPRDLEYRIIEKEVRETEIERGEF